MKRYLKTKMRKFSMNKAEKKTEIPPIPEPPTPEIDESKPSFYLGRLPQFVCPSLVILSVELPKQKSVFAKRVYGSGFIYYSDPNFSIVWGVSRFLEQKEKENLRRGEVNVRVNAGNGDSFPGTVLHVDFEHHLVVVKIYCGKQPTATLAPLDPLPSQLLCYDFMPMIPMYKGYNNTPRFLPQFEPCGYSLHLDRQFLTHMTGVVLNDHRDIIGLKTGDCKVHSDYAIVLPVEKLEQCLSSVTARFMDTHNDADFRTQFGDEPASTSDDTLPKEEEPFNIYGLTDEQKAIRLLFLENQPCNFVSGFVFGK